MARLFHTLVVYGASAALSGCGAGDEEARTETPGEGGAGGDAAGAPGVELGGASGDGGGGGAAGSTQAPVEGGAGGLATDAGPPLGPPPSTYARWSCGPELQCNGREFELDAPCPEDPSRPGRPADCAPDEWFQCHRAALGGATIMVNCSCQSMVTFDGCSECAEELGWEEYTVECNGPVSACGCVYTGILR